MADQDQSLLQVTGDGKKPSALTELDVAELAIAEAYSADDRYVACE